MNTFAKLTDICVGFLVIALIAVAVNPLLPQKYQSSVISSAFGYGFPDADFSVSCTPASSSVYQGDDAYFSLGTTAIGEFTEPVTWVVTDVSPVNAEMPVISVISNDQVPSYVSQLLAETTLATSPGTYTISLDAQASSVTRTCSVELVVEEPLPTPDYSVSCSLANPATITVGETSVVTLSTVGINGFSNAVTWTVNDVSPYMTSQPEYLFNDNNLVPDADTTVYISTDENTSTGTFTFVFGASDGDIPRTCTAELTINAVSVSPPVFTGGGGSGSSLPPVSVTPPVSSAPPTVSEGGASCVDAVATASLKPLYRLWNPRITNHFYTTDSAERGAALKAGYTPEGVVGSLYPTQVTGTYPLYRLWNAKLTAHLYTFDDSERDAAVRSGYRYDGVQGYGFKEKVEGANPFYSMLNSDQYDHFYTFSDGEISFATDLGYKLEGITGYICGGSQVGPDTVPLFRMFSSREQKHFYTESVVEREDLQKSGYKTESTLGYVFVGPQLNTAPVYRLYSSKDLNHYYTSKLEERDAAIARGYKFEKVSGYVYAESHDGTTAIYALANPRGNKNFYTTSVSERDGLVRRGYVDLGILGYIKISE